MKTPRRAVPFEPNRLAVPATDPTTRPCTGCALPGSDRTSVRPRRLNGVCRRSYRRTRDALVCLDERQAAQLLGVPAIRRTARRYRRGVRHNHRSPHGSVDLADVSELRLNQGHNAASGHAHLSLRLRRPRGSRHKRDVPETARRRSTADGTARVPQVGQPRLAGVTTLSPSQRGAHEPASCLRGIDVAETPSERKPRRSRREDVIDDCLSVCDCVRNCCDWNLVFECIEC